MKFIKKLLICMAVAVIVLTIVVGVGTAQPGRMSPQGGTITHVNMGSGGTGSGNSGPITVNVVPRTGGGLSATADDLGLLTTCANDEVLKWNGTAWACGTAGIGGTGTTNTVSKWTGASTLGNSTITEVSGAVSIAGTLGLTAIPSNSKGVYAQADASQTGTLQAAIDGTISSTWTAGTAPFSVGVYGKSNSVRSAGTDLTNAGVFGESTIANGTATNIGVYGSATGSSIANWAAWFQGAARVTGALTVDGNSTLGDAVGDVLDFNGDLAKFGGADGATYFYQNTMNWGYDTNATATAYLNWSGYQNGTTQFRNLSIRDGKNAEVALFTGSDKSVDFQGQTTKFGSAVDGDTYIQDNTLNFKYGVNGAATGAINLFGYNGGTTQERDLIIGDGQGANVMTLDGGSKRVDFLGPFYTNAATTLGDASADTLTVNATTTHTAPTTVQDFRGTDITSTAVGTQHDFAPASLSTATVLLLNPASALTITGLTGGTANRELTLCNISTQAVSLVQDNSGSTAPNRFYLPSATTLPIPGTTYWNGGNSRECAVLLYNGTASRWTVKSHALTSVASFETTTQLYNAGVMTTIGTGTFGSNISAGNDADDLTTFSNGPRGVNKYEGKHYEWNEEWLQVGTLLNNNVAVGAIYTYSISGSGAGATSNASRVNAIGVANLVTGTTSTGNVLLTTDPSALWIGDGTFTFETTIWHEDVSTVDTEEFYSLHGFFDTNGADQVDGCYFAYDNGQNATAPGTGNRGASGVDKWQCWCSSNSVRTAYLMDGTIVSQGSFTTVNTPLTQDVWQRLKIVVTGTTSAEFYVDGTKRCHINTNIPATSARLSGAGHLWRKQFGTTSRMLNIDQTRLDAVMTNTRSP